MTLSNIQGSPLEASAFISPPGIPSADFIVPASRTTLSLQEAPQVNNAAAAVANQRYFIETIYLYLSGPAASDTFFEILNGTPASGTPRFRVPIVRAANEIFRLELPVANIENLTPGNAITFRCQNIGATNVVDFYSAFYRIE